MPVFEVRRLRSVHVRRKELSCLCQLVNVAESRIHRFRCLVRVSCYDIGFDGIMVPLISVVFSITKRTDDVVADIIHVMYRTAVNVKNDVITVQFVLMYHLLIFLTLLVSYAT